MKATPLASTRWADLQFCTALLFACRTLTRRSRMYIGSAGSRLRAAMRRASAAPPLIPRRALSDVCPARRPPGARPAQRRDGRTQAVPPRPPQRSQLAPGLWAARAAPPGRGAPLFAAQRRPRRAPRCPCQQSGRRRPAARVASRPQAEREARPHSAHFPRAAARAPLLSRPQVEREVRLHGSLAHENIVSLHAAFQEGHYTVMVQEVRGQRGLGSQ